MFFTMRSTFQLTTVLVALAANACAAHGIRPVESALAQVSCVGGVVETAADAELYGACERVNGDLRISAPELDDLSALAGLRSVSGKLEIANNPELDDLSGLERLEQVGSLSIRDNAELGSLRGLEGLTRVETLVIERNGLYQTTGLSNLTEVGALVVADNAKLNSLGLRSLSHAGSVEIRNNPRLCARGLLPALARVDHDVSLSANRGLSQPEVRQLLGRVEHRLARPSTDSAARMEASLR